MPHPRKPANPFRYFHSSPEVIRLVVLMYVRFPLSLRNVEDLLFERGVDICHETVRLWWNRFGPLFASDIRRQRVSAMRGFRHWRWHLDEMYVKINGELHYLWRAVDHEGEVLESFVTKKRDKSAALEFMKRTLKRHGKAEAIVTDGLKSYPAAMRELGNLDRLEMGRWLNNRVENSHLPIRRRERVMLRFRRMKTLQKFSSVHAQVHNHFSQERHLVSRQEYKRRRSAALAEWQNLVAWGKAELGALASARDEFASDWQLPVERLGNYLLIESDDRDGAFQFDIPIEKRTLASLLGMTPENLSRAFGVLAAHGVNIDGSVVQILDREKLTTFAKPDAFPTNEMTV